MKFIRVKCFAANSILVVTTSHPVHLTARSVSAQSEALYSCAALWNTYGDCANYGILSGSKGAVTDLAWSATGEHIYSGSADCNLSTWDARTGTRLRKHIGHQEFVNSIDILKVGTGLIISGSDDATIGVSSDT